MPVTDQEQLLREALVTVLTADADVQALTGRATRNVLERDTLAADVSLPVLAYDLLATDMGAGQADLLLTAVTNGANAGAVARALLEAAADALTHAALLAAGADVVPLGPGIRRSVDELEDVRDRLALESPTLQQADWSLRLLLLT